MQAGDVALDGFGAVRHGAVDPHADLRIVAALEIATEVRRNLHRQADIAIAQASFQLVVVGERRLLQEVARTMRSIVPISDCLARLGGDEFAVILPGGSDSNCTALTSGGTLTGSLSASR